MKAQQKIIGVIPARAGSKGIKHKNLSLLNGKPLIQYTIEASENSKLLDFTIISTDDQNVVELSKAFNVRVPFKRPDILSTDTASSVDVVLHVLEYLEKNEKYVPDAIVLLQPTCPLRNAKDIDDAIVKYISKNEKYGIKSLLSVNKPSEHPCECITIENGHMKFAIEGSEEHSRRQTFSEYYFMNGAIYISSVDLLKEKKVFFDPDEANAFFIMHPSHSVDIDEMFDLNIAEGLIKTGSVV